MKRVIVAMLLSSMLLATEKEPIKIKVDDELECVYGIGGPDDCERKLQLQQLLKIEEKRPVYKVELVNPESGGEWKWFVGGGLAASAVWALLWYSKSLAK